MSVKYPAIEYNKLGLAVESGQTIRPSIWFGGGRIGVHVESHDMMEEIVYYGAQPINRGLFYKVTKHSPYQKLFCPYLLIENRAYFLEWQDSHIYPAGSVNRFSIPNEGIELVHELIVLNGAVLINIKVLRNDHQFPLSIRMSLHEFLRHDVPCRIWEDWDVQMIPGAVVRKIQDLSDLKDPNCRDYVTTLQGVVASEKIRTHLSRSGRRYFETERINGDSACIAVVFGMNEAAFLSRVDELAKYGNKMAANQIGQWNDDLQNAITLQIDEPAVESFFRQAGLISKMLMPTDLPGGMRAAVGHYWIWGWDTLVYSDSYLLSKNNRFVIDTLDLYRRTTHPELGIGHQFDQHMKLNIPQALPAQTLYINTLYQYVTYTNDLDVLNEYYDFAKQIFLNNIAQSQKAGMFTGIALWPDFPQHAGQLGDDQDISIFNNSIFYQAACVMEHMAGMMGDLHIARIARQVIAEMLVSFRKHFWDDKHAYWVDSIDSEILEQRKSYPAHAILWINSFASRLVNGRESACARFLSENHVCSGGIRPFPLWDPAFNGDGNQLGQYYPTGVDVFFLKMMGAAGKQEMLERWLGWIADFWRQHTVPEGVTLEAENDGPSRCDCPGGKQPFTAKPWHVGLVQGIVGIDLDHGGITVGPGLDRPTKLERFEFQGKTYSIETSGSGLYIQQIKVNGKVLQGSCKIPGDWCTDDLIRVEIIRTSKKPQRIVILSATGATLSELYAQDMQIAVDIFAYGLVQIAFTSPEEPNVFWKGNAVDFSYDPNSCKGCVTLCPEEIELVGKIKIVAKADFVDRSGREYDLAFS